jgi:hypothetical protein
MEVENDKYYQIYVDGIIDLASSIVLKCEDAARSINRQLLENNITSFDEHNPRTWKYYRNICGEYFQSDEPMYVTSLDSLEPIEFSKQNLEFHRATKKAYAFGTTYYKELIAAYPDQDQLIHGILYPADMEEAIAAYDGQILAYPKDYVEVTEPSLIPQLQEWINGFYRRWHNVQYQNTDNLYLAGMLAVLYSQMPGAIENIRMEACLTHEAHSYHVKEYLASHSKLDKYWPYMTRSQAMFFYHNLAYIENNSGRQEIFDELLQRVFTDRNLPLGHFSLMHSTEHMPADSLTPLVVFEKTPLNTTGNIDNKDQYSLSEVLDIEDALLPSGQRYREDEQTKIANLATYTLNPNVPTKLLQSTVIDYTDSEKYRFADILLHHWLWLSYRNLYKAYVSFIIPATGARISLTPLDAFTFYAYAFCKGMGLEIEKLPTVVARRVQRLPGATVESMREVCEYKYVSDDWLRQTRGMMPPASEMISLDAFRRHADELFKVANEQYSMTALEERMTPRAQKEAAVARLWSDEKFTLGDYEGQQYTEWFAERNLVVKDLTNTQLLEVSNVILAEATGANLSSTITLKDIQRYMRDLFLDLSSYSIHIGLNINTGPVLQGGFTQVRTDDLDIKTGKHLFLEVPTVDPSKVKTQGKQSKFLDMNRFPVMTLKRHDQFRRQALPINPVKVAMDNGKITIPRRLEVRAVYKTHVNLTAPNPRNLTVVPGMEKFLELPLETQLASYVDTWAK